MKVKEILLDIRQLLQSSHSNGEVTEDLREDLNHIKERQEEIMLVLRRQKAADVTCYSKETVAEMLEVSPSTIERKRRDGQLRGVKIRSQWRYPHQQVIKYLRSREVG